MATSAVMPVRKEGSATGANSGEIRWSFIVWMAGLINAVAMLPQFVQIIRTHNIQGLSLEMFVLYFLVQIAFSLEGFFKKNRMLMVCMGLSAVVSGTIILLVTYLRHFGG